MDNKKVNYKMLKYVMVHLDIKKEYELTGEQAIIYGFLYNHCINLNGSATQSGWCGLSNDNIAEFIGIAEKTVSRSIKALKDKELIIVENERQRTRRISLSPKPFYCEETKKALDEVELLKKQLENAHKQLELMNSRLLMLQEEPTISYLAKDLINTGYVTKEEYMKNWKDYNMLLEQFQLSVGIVDFQKRLSYVVSNIQKQGKIYDKVAYLRDSLVNNAIDYHRVIKMFDEVE